MTLCEVIKKWGLKLDRILEQRSYQKPTLRVEVRCFLCTQEIFLSLYLYHKLDALLKVICLRYGYGCNSIFLILPFLNMRLSAHYQINDKEP